MDGKTILVTGGAGFIGSNIVYKLWKMNVKKIIIYDNLFSGRFNNISPIIGEKVQFVKGDIRDFELLKKTCDNIDIICHQAAWGSVPRSLTDPLEYHNNNVTGFLNILEVARIKNIKRVIYASSSSVYGDDTNLPRKEDKIGKQLSPYALTKYIDEMYADLYMRCYGLEVIGLRYFNVFGNLQDPEGVYAAVIPKFIKLILEGNTLTINGDGNISRDFTFVDNVVDFNIKCMETNNKEVFGKVFNVGSGVSYTLNELVDKLGEVMLRSPNVKYGPRRKGDVDSSLADITLGKELLGYEPIVNFEEGLRKTVHYFQNYMV